MIQHAEETSRLVTLMEDPKFWVACAFFAFFAVFGKMVLRALLGALDARSAKIRHDLDEARRLREEAETVLASYRSKYKESMHEAESILTKAREDADHMLRRAEEDVKVMIASRTAMANEKISQAEKQAIQDVQEHVVDITITAAKTLIMENLSQVSGDELVRMAIADIERKVH